MLDLLENRPAGRAGLRGAGICLFVLSTSALVLAACAGPGSPPVAAPTPQPTATVDLAATLATFRSGGALTLQQLAAVYLSVVGAEPDLGKDASGDFDKYSLLLSQFAAREEEFETLLSKCTLKESQGWISAWGTERTSDYRKIPNLERVSVLVSDPYAAQAAGSDEPGLRFVELLSIPVTQTASMRSGKRILVSGKLDWVDGGAAVSDARIKLLEDEPLPLGQQTTEQDLAGFEVQLVRTQCFGNCPVYTLTIRGDGGVEFQGSSHVTATGMPTATIDKAALFELIREIRKAGFFDLNNTYVTDTTDLPTYYLTVQLNGKIKRIEHHGTAPARLWILEDRVDEVANTYQWIGQR